MVQTTTPKNYIPVPVGCPPEAQQGQVTIPVDFDFSIATSFEVDFSALENKGTISGVQSFYIDNLSNTTAVVITDEVTGQSITIPFACQGYMPLLSKNPNKLSVACSSNTQACRINFNNFYMPPYLWGAAIGSQ